jgi:hypothetical protein
MEDEYLNPTSEAVAHLIIEEDPLQREDILKSREKHLLI